MKKFAIMAVLVVATASASAIEVGIRGVHTSKSSGDMVGVTVGQSFGAFGAEAAYDRTTRGAANVNRWSLVGTVPVAKYAGVSFAAKAGAVFVDPSVSKNGYAVVAGVGASYPLTKNVSLVADYAYQVGQDRVRSFNGNQVSAGVKVSF